MRLIPVGLGVVAALQAVAAVAAYPVLTLAVGMAASLLGTIVSREPGAGTVLVFAGLPMAFGVLMLSGVFLAVPLGVSVAAAIVVGRLGRRRRAEAGTLLLLKFGAAVLGINVAALLAGVMLWPVWWYSEKLATLIPLWPLILGFAINAGLDAAVAAVTLRSQLSRR